MLSLLFKFLYASFVLVHSLDFGTEYETKYVADETIASDTEAEDTLIDIGTVDEIKDGPVEQITGIVD